MPLEAAREHLAHWWREPLAGFVAIGIGMYQIAITKADGGLNAILIVTGIVLIAGSKRLFMWTIPGMPTPPAKPNGEKK